MCDSGCSDRKNGNQGESVAEIKPNWLKCPPIIRERVYPIPEGVEITPISEGGRNGSNSKKNKFKCGQCGEDKKKESPKPNAPADCPMMKSRNCTGVGEASGEKKVSIIDKVKSLFGIGKDIRLIEACKHLRVQDEQIRHHRDVFNTQLLCRKDGYFSPIFTRVDCQSPPEDGCTCGEEEVLEGEDCDEYGDDDQEYDEDDYYEDQDVDVVCAEGETETVVEQESMICTCQCITTPCTGDDQVTPQDTTSITQEEEECVEDAEGECVIEESAECMDPACKFFFEDQDGKKKAKPKFDEVYSKEEQGQQDCIAMNNFIIRVQAPFSESTTNETCEQIVARLTNRKPQYPEPGPKPEKTQAKTGETGKERIEIVVKQISVEEPTCECEKPKPKCKKLKEDVKKEEPTPTSECNDSPPPPPPKDECNDFPPPPPPKYECKDIPPPKEPECECKCNSEFEQETLISPLLQQCQNDCERLTETELLKKPLKDIKCGCPKPTCLGCQESPSVTRTCENASVWIPPPPPPCPRCGTPERGGTEDCYLCHLTRRMRSGCPELPDKPPNLLDDLQKKIVEPSDSCSPEYLEDGSLKYKGGMCMSLANSFLWHIVKRTAPGGFFDRFTGECGEEAKLKAVTGTDTYSDAVQACYNNAGERVPCRGGESMENCKRFLWGNPRIDEEEEIEKARRQCKPRPQKEPPSGPGDQCPPR